MLKVFIKIYCRIFKNNDLAYYFQPPGNWRGTGRLMRNMETMYPTFCPSYDAFVFINKTKALHPLHLTPYDAQMPDTYPYGF